MENFEEKKLSTNDINEGKHFTRQQGISADTFNKIVEGVLYADSRIDKILGDLEETLNGSY